jgi:hypothetical protein
MAKFIFGELYSTEKSFHTLLKFTYNVSKKKIRSNVILLKKKKKKKKKKRNAELYEDDGEGSPRSILTRKSK